MHIYLYMIIAIHEMVVMVGKPVQPATTPTTTTPFITTGSQQEGINANTWRQGKKVQLLSNTR